MNRNIRFASLPNGLRIVAERIHQQKVATFGVAIAAGSRDELPCHYGLAHFVEHTIFKGTDHRRASHIINRMDSVGGELNAFTTKEETNVYSTFPASYLPRAVELIADLVRNSVFPARELDRERVVVREEIDSYLDSPAEAIFDDFEDLFFKNSQLGHNILGETRLLDSFTSDVCRQYIQHAYTPDRMVAFYRGPMAFERVEALINRSFGDMTGSSSPSRCQPHPQPVFDITRNLDTHQVHCVMGTHTPNIYSHDRYALGLLANILGGPAMNSRLNVALRERRGLVYTVDANLTLLSDCGMFTIYFGCDPADAEQCIDLVRRELLTISTTAITPRQLAAAKKQYLGQLVVASDNSEQMALNAARTALYFNQKPDDTAARKAIDELNPDALAEAAQLLAPTSFSILRFA